MGRIPLPPGTKPPEHHSKPREAPKAGKGVGRDDINWILKTTLDPEHREDPNVVGFIINYVQCRSVSQAARAVGLHPNQGAAIKRRADVHEAIAQITSLSIMEYDYDAAEVVERVKEIVNIDPGVMQKPDGSFIESLHELPPEVRRAIKYFKARNTYEKDPNGMKVVTGTVIEVEFWDKMKGVELLGREKNIFKETKVHKHDITENMSNYLLESKKLANQAVVEYEKPQVAMIDVTPKEVKDE